MSERSAIHECPRDGGGGLTPCCGRTPFELPRLDRMASDPARVTCWTGDDPRLTNPTPNGDPA